MMDRNETNELRLTVELIDGEILFDYGTVIFPDIYELLAETAKEQPIEQAYLCIGVKDGSAAVAALVLEMEETGDLVIRSLYVEDEYRRMHIGTQLFHDALDIAAESFIFQEGMDQELVHIRESSMLREDAHSVWHAFLESVGFSEFSERPGSFVLDAQELKDCGIFHMAFSNGYTPAARFVQASELPEAEQQELAEAVEDSYSPYYSIVSGSAQARETIVIVDQATTDVYRLLLADRAPVTLERDLIRALCTAFWLIRQDTPAFTLVVREDIGAAVPLLSQALPKDARMFVDERGQMDIVFQA